MKQRTFPTYTNILQVITTSLFHLYFNKKSCQKANFETKFKGKIKTLESLEVLLKHTYKVQWHFV